jgi:hypothetical protein
MMAPWIFQVCFNSGYSGAHTPFTGDGIYKWLRALWKIRETCGPRFADAAMLYTLKLVDESVSRGEFDQWFYTRFTHGAWVADNQGEKTPIINTTLKEEFLIS